VLAASAVNRQYEQMGMPYPIDCTNEAVAGSVKKLRDCGRISRYEHDVIGYTSRLNSINAAIGRVQLRHLDE
jgi:perosamine synthetase